MSISGLKKSTVRYLYYHSNNHYCYRLTVPVSNDTVLLLLLTDTSLLQLLPMLMALLLLLVQLCSCCSLCTKLVAVQYCVKLV